MDPLVILKALADESRLKIYKQLLSGSETPSSLSEKLKMIPSTVSFHLQKLSDAGLITSSQDARVLYSADVSFLERSFGDVLFHQGNESAKEESGEEAYRKQVLKTFFKDGKLLKIPDQNRKKDIVLRRVSQRLVKDQVYSESELDEALKKLYADFATLKKELVASRFIKASKGTYSVAGE